MHLPADSIDRIAVTLRYIALVRIPLHLQKEGEEAAHHVRTAFRIVQREFQPFVADPATLRNLYLVLTKAYLGTSYDIGSARFAERPDDVLLVLEGLQTDRGRRAFACRSYSRLGATFPTGFPHAEAAPAAEETRPARTRTWRPRRFR